MEIQKTKIQEFHIRFSCFFQKLEISKKKHNNSQLVTPSYLWERSIWSFCFEKYQNLRNPRKIFIFSKNIFHCAVAPQIWAHNSSWALRTMHLKFAKNFTRISWLLLLFLTPFLHRKLETFREISIDHNFLNICRISFFFDVLKSYDFSLQKRIRFW